MLVWMCLLCGKKNWSGVDFKENLFSFFLLSIVPCFLWTKKQTYCRDRVRNFQQSNILEQRKTLTLFNITNLLKKLPRAHYVNESTVKKLRLNKETWRVLTTIGQRAHHARKSSVKKCYLSHTNETVEVTNVDFAQKKLRAFSGEKK